MTGMAEHHSPAAGQRRVGVIASDLADHARPRSLRPHLVRSAVFLALIGVFVTCWAVGLTFSTLAALAQVGVRTPDLGPAANAFLTLFGLGGMIVFGLGWLLSLLVPVREFVDGADVLLIDAADRRATALDTMRTLLEDRCPPFTLVDGKADGQPSLRLRSDDAWAVVDVREIGPDLYIGWSMWRDRSTIRLFGRVFADMVRGSQAPDPKRAAARSTAAMRELLHHALDRTADRATDE